MNAFDVNTYRKQVLARLRDDFSLADPDTGDLFLVCDVDPSADSAAATGRLDDVVAAWQRDRNHPRYKDIAAQLVARRSAYAAILGNPVALEQARLRILNARAKVDAAALAQLDSLTAELVRRHGAIRSSKVAILRDIAADDGLSEVAFATWLSRQRVQNDSAALAAPWETSVRQQIRKALDGVARAEPTLAERHRTLLTFLGVPTNATAAQIRSAHARLGEANQSRVRDRVMSLTEDLLAQVATRLLAADGMAGYAASLRADARDTFKTEMRRRALLTGSLPAADFEAMVARVLSLGWGFDASAAVDIVRDAAHEMQLAVEVNATIDLVVCGACRQPQTPGPSSRCEYCRADLYQECPSCLQRILTACEVCPRCSSALSVWKAARTVVPQAREHLVAGRPAAAQVLCQDAVGGGDPAATPAELRELLTVARKTVDRADQLWEALHADRAQGRLWSASSSATWLVRNAVDVPNPQGRPSAAEVLAELERCKEAVSAAVAAAAALPAEQAAAELGRILREHPDSPDASTALAALPLAPPAQVSVSLTGGAAHVTWAPAPALSRDVRYRLERHVIWPQRRTATTTIGTTTATHLEDAGAPAGTRVTYTVTAVDGPRTSGPVGADAEVFIERDVEVLQARAEGQRVELTWPASDLGEAEVVIEREVLPGSGITAPIRRIIPSEPGRYVDEGVQYGVPYSYRVSLRYHHEDGQVVRTPGHLAQVTAFEPPRAVREILVRTKEGHRTVVRFPPVPSGTVQVYARPGLATDGAPLGGFSTGTLNELVAAARGARLVGQGKVAVSDTAARGPVVYQAVTVSGDAAIAGPFAQHLAVPTPATPQVLEDDGKHVRLQIFLPRGVTEAVVCWRRDRYPESADEAADARAGSGRQRVTNAKLEIDGGFTIPAPSDGRPVFVVVFPAMRSGSTVLTALEGRGVISRAVPE